MTGTGEGWPYRLKLVLLWVAVVAMALFVGANVLGSLAILLDTLAQGASDLDRSVYPGVSGRPGGDCPG